MLSSTADWHGGMFACRSWWRPQ